MAPQACTLSSIIANLPRPPSKAQRAANRQNALNPIAVCRLLTLKQWCYFVVGVMAWVIDSLDFFAVSLTLKRLEGYFGKSAHTLTTSVTLTLLFRSLGAFLFGAISDRYGRRWPLTANLLIVAALELGSGFVQSFGAFLAVRSLFGIGMGGIWGMAAATALENAPPEARGLLSGIMQQGYALGYLIAAAIFLTVVPHYDSWRPIFYIGAGLSAFVAVCRAILPESEVFIRARQHAKEHPDPQGRSATRIYFSSLKMALKLHWATFIYAVITMSAFNFLSHGSQDLYPVFVQTSKGISEHNSTVLVIIGNCGAITGGVIAGAVSQTVGRRLTAIFMCVWTACFIPLWIKPDSFSGLAAGAFFLQFGVQGAWGIVPIWLNEISPASFRVIFSGLAYQLGNMVSSASAQIEATAGAQHKVLVNGKEQNDYSFVQAVLIGVIAGSIIILMLFGPEHTGRSFDQEKTAIEEGGGDDSAAISAEKDGHHGKAEQGSSDLEHASPRTDITDVSEKEKFAYEEERKE